MTIFKKRIFVLVGMIAGSTAFGLLSPKKPTDSNGKKVELSLLPAKPPAQQLAEQKKQADEKRLSSDQIKKILNAGLKERYDKNLQAKVDKKAKEPYVLGYLAIDPLDWKAEEFFAPEDKVNKAQSSTLIGYAREHKFKPLSGVILYQVLYSNGQIKWFETEMTPKGYNKGGAGRTGEENAGAAQAGAASGDEVTEDDLKYGGW